VKVWRIAYLDEDFGSCYAWASTKKSAKALTKAICKHYAGLGGYVPEVLPPVTVDIPTGRGKRGPMVAWLNVNLARAPAPPKATDPATANLEWQDDCPHPEPLWINGKRPRPNRAIVQPRAHETLTS
jgi:hypothetical protein